MRVYHISMVGALMALAGCATEVGVGAPNATFGETTQNNLFAQAIEYRHGGEMTDLQMKFDEEANSPVNFDFNKSSLDAEARAQLDRQATWLLANASVRVRVTGHTDLVGGEAYNDKLGLQRARAVARYLQEQGVARGRVDAVESRGERDPLIPTEDRERRNRRTVTEVAGFTHGFIGDGMDGNRAVIMYRRYKTDSVQKPSTAETAGQ